MTEHNAKITRCQALLLMLSSVAFVVILYGGLIWARDADTSERPKYSMAITGVAGLDADDVASSTPTLSPVFNLTLHIDNNLDCDMACVPDLSTASVSYGGVSLGEGLVCPICAQAKGEREVRVRASGQDVAVPRFLRRQLAGEMLRGNATVHVTVKMPAGCNRTSCYEKVLACRAKIRGGPPCLMAVSKVKV